MEPRPTRGLAWVAYRPLLLGVVASFCACVVTGWALRKADCYRDVQRFHPGINYQSLHYPTVPHVRAMARHRFTPEKILVVVGGNSVLYGSGTSDQDVWTARLQALLGDRYQILNLGLNGAMTAEFGATAAEVLASDFPRLIFVSNVWAGPECSIGDPDGRPFIRSFFWEARQRGWLLDHPARDERLRELTRQRAANGEAAFGELRTQTSLDAALHFRDLWTTAEYRHRSTVWSPLTAPRWWRPRRDHAAARHTGGRNPTAVLDSSRDAELGRLRELRGYHRRMLRERGGIPWDDPNPQARTCCMVESVRLCFPDALRARALVLVCDPNPYFLDQLPEDEKGFYDEMAAQTVGVLERTGMTAVEAGRSYPAEFYFDTVHLTKEGGHRLAEEVAPRVRALAGRLGYLPQQ